MLFFLTAREMKREKSISIPQFLCGIPEVLAEVYDLVVYHLNAFRFEELFHDTGAPEMVFSRKGAVAVDHAVGRDVFAAMVRAVHGPAHHARRSDAAQVSGDGAIGGDPPGGDETHHLEHLLEKGGISHGSGGCLARSAGI